MRRWHAKQGQGSQAELQRDHAGGEPPWLIVNTEVFDGNGERNAMAAPGDAGTDSRETRQVNGGGDKAYRHGGISGRVQKSKVTPQCGPEPRATGGSAMDARTTQHVGYAISQRKRKRIEECFGC